MGKKIAFVVSLSLIAILSTLYIVRISLDTTSSDAILWVPVVGIICICGVIAILGGMFMETGRYL